VRLRLARRAGARRRGRKRPVAAGGARHVQRARAAEGAARSAASRDMTGESAPTEPQRRMRGAVALPRTAPRSAATRQPGRAAGRSPGAETRAARARRAQQTEPLRRSFRASCRRPARAPAPRPARCCRWPRSPATPCAETGAWTPERGQGDEAPHRLLASPDLRTQHALRAARGAREASQRRLATGMAAIPRARAGHSAQGRTRPLSGARDLPPRARATPPTHRLARAALRRIPG
jgi:hypothetical protein